uniref:Uncharacterized protein n=1 Tax=Rhodopseudomonas palustris (strain BisA53) TaxID=316055 RepID=Q07J26_RHOP5
MTKRPPKLLMTPRMAQQREAERATPIDEAYEGCRRAIRRGMSVYARAERRCPLKLCKRARACVSDSFVCLSLLKRPVLPAIDEQIAVDGLYQHWWDSAAGREAE